MEHRARAAEVNFNHLQLALEGKLAASRALRCCTHTRVLNIKPHMTSALLEIVPGQVVHAILVHFVYVTQTTSQRQGRWQ